MEGITINIKKILCVDPLSFCHYYYLDEHFFLSFRLVLIKAFDNVSYKILDIGIVDNTLS